MTDAKDTPSSQPPTFEVALEQLQQTVKRMESGELTLEQALQHFETGVRLTRLCQERLTAAEHRVEILMKGADAQDGSAVEMQAFVPPTR